MRRAAAIVALAVLGAGCTGDRATDGQMQEASPSPLTKPRCGASLGAPPEGFLLVRSREFPYPNHVGVREDYRHEDGRLLVYLLGVTGEMGEGATIVEDVELATGQPATLFGTEGTDAWSVVWAQDQPCPQMAVVGNGFTREDFLSALEENGILAGL